MEKKEELLTYFDERASHGNLHVWEAGWSLFPVHAMTLLRPLFGSFLSIGKVIFFVQHWKSVSYYFSFIGCYSHLFKHSNSPSLLSTFAIMDDWSREEVMVVDMHGFAIPGSLVFGTQTSNPSSFNTFENLKFTGVWGQRPNFWSLVEGKSIKLNGKRLELTCLSTQLLLYIFSIM